MSQPPTEEAEEELDELIQRISDQLNGPATEETVLKLASAWLRAGDYLSELLRVHNARWSGQESSQESSTAQPAEPDGHSGHTGETVEGERAGEGAMAPSPTPPTPERPKRQPIPCPACGASDGVRVSTLLVNVRGKGKKGQPSGDGCVDASTWTCPACGQGGSREDYQRFQQETPDQRRRRRIGELYPEYQSDEGYRQLWLDGLSITATQAKQLTPAQIAAMRRYLDELIDAKQHGNFPPTPPAKERRLETVEAGRLQ